MAADRCLLFMSGIGGMTYSCDKAYQYTARTAVVTTGEAKPSAAKATAAAKAEAEAEPAAAEAVVEAPAQHNLHQLHRQHRYHH